MTSLSRSLASALLVGMTVLVGCAGVDVDPEVDSTESELTLPGVKLLGEIDNGETKNGEYTSTPQHRAFSFKAKGGDEVTAEVRLLGGTAEAFITDEANVVLAEASGDATGARVKLKVPAAQPSSTFRVVFKDASRPTATFAAKVSVLSGAPVCSYGGSSYGSGQQFQHLDRCNTCTCFGAGSISCTKQTCQCNPAAEAGWRRYLGTPAQCLQLHVSCLTTERPFANSCGCGCELLDH